MTQSNKTVPPRPYLDEWDEVVTRLHQQNARLKIVAQETAADWFTLPPKLRTKEKLLVMLRDAMSTETMKP
jgi:hypothetical protein